MKKDKKHILTFLLFCILAVTSGCLFSENRKINKLNQILQAGNEALYAKQYNEAIRLYDSGLLIAPEEPVFLSNKSTAFRFRGADRYNSAIRLTDQKEKTDGIEAAKSDFRESASFSAKAVKAIESARLLELLGGYSHEARKLNVFTAHAESMRLFATVVDKTKADEALQALHKYIEIEPDEEKKTKALLNTGKMLIETGNGEKAILEYRKILDTNADHTEALLGVGLALSQSGDSKKFKEAEYYLQRFVSQASDDHPLKAEIKSTLDYMKQKGNDMQKR